MDPRIDYPAEYRQFIRLFNAREFYESHEVLEDLWVMEVPPLRDFYKGLIQAAVALCHWERGNHAPALRLWRLARNYLAPYPRWVEGLDLGGFLVQMDALFAPLLTQDDATPPAPPRSMMPVLQLVEPPL